MGSGDIKIGDVVKLKSGGPLMTVDRAAANGVGGRTSRFRCVWFAGEARVEGEFDTASLMISGSSDNGCY